MVVVVHAIIVYRTNSLKIKQEDLVGLLDTEALSQRATQTRYRSGRKCMWIIHAGKKLLQITFRNRSPVEHTVKFNMRKNLGQTFGKIQCLLQGNRLLQSSLFLLQLLLITEQNVHLHNIVVMANYPTLLSFIPARCWIAPEIPTAMYSSCEQSEQVHPSPVQTQHELAVVLMKSRMFSIITQ